MNNGVEKYCAGIRYEGVTSAGKGSLVTAIGGISMSSAFFDFDNGRISLDFERAGVESP